jgi:tol-pal system protein YbgF
MDVFRRIVVVVALVTAVAAGPASAANKEMQALQVQVTNLQGQVADLQRVIEDSMQAMQKELKRLGETVAEQNASQKRATQDRRLQDEALQSSLRDIQERLSELRERVQTMPTTAPAAAPVVTSAPPPTLPSTDGAQGAPMGVPTPSPAPAASTPTPPRELYSQAYADFARGNYDLAIQGFQEYIKNYQTDFTDNAQYWIGECYYGKQQFQEAVAALDVLLKDYPTSDKLPDGHVKKGLALEKLGRRSDAVREYRVVIDRYPSAPAARIAREKLAAQ